jgi:hypothetical protein
MKIFLQITFCLLPVVGIISCDHYHEQHFYINNDLDTAIFMHFDAGDRIDSTVTISQKSTQEIFSYGGAFGSAGVSDERYDDPIKNLKFQTNDTIVELNEALWIFEKETKYHGNSTIKIDSSLLH